VQYNPTAELLPPDLDNEIESISSVASWLILIPPLCFIDIKSTTECFVANTPSKTNVTQTYNRYFMFETICLQVNFYTLWKHKYTNASRISHPQ
jgi:hypothetical protein